jgi:hypothetical protein
MEATSAAVFMTLALALVLFGTSYYYLTTRHKERLALLEKGLSPTAFHRPGACLPGSHLLLSRGKSGRGLLRPADPSPTRVAHRLLSSLLPLPTHETYLALLLTAVLLT